jgi:hypothetical protein
VVAGALAAGPLLTLAKALHGKSILSARESFILLVTTFASSLDLPLSLPLFSFLTFFSCLYALYSYSAVPYHSLSPLKGSQKGNKDPSRIFYWDLKVINPEPQPTAHRLLLHSLRAWFAHPAHTCISNSASLEGTCPTGLIYPRVLRI